jgi:hypothetical protein
MTSPRGARLLHTIVAMGVALTGGAGASACGGVAGGLSLISDGDAGEGGDARDAGDAAYPMIGSDPGDAYAHIGIDPDAYPHIGADPGDAYPHIGIDTGEAASPLGTDSGDAYAHIGIGPEDGYPTIR